MHSQSEALVIDSDKGNGFDVLVDSIKEGSVSDVHIQTAGSNYQVGDVVQFTGGGGIVPAQHVLITDLMGGGFELEDGTGVLVFVNLEHCLVKKHLILHWKTQNYLMNPYYVFGTANYDQLGAGLTGYFYPLYLSQGWWIWWSIKFT